MDPIKSNPFQGLKTNLSVAAQVTDKHSRIISKGNKTHRLIFQNENQRTDLNFSILDPNNAKEPSSLFGKRWVRLTFNINNQDATIYANINSISKRLGIAKPQIHALAKEGNLENTIEVVLKESPLLMNNQILPNTSLSITPPPLKLGSFLERVKGALADAWWKFTTGSWDLFRFRFLVRASDEQLQREGLRRAISAFYNAVERVPAYACFYRSHLKKEDGTEVMPRQFQEIPETGKKEYIQQKDMRWNEFFLDGRIPQTGQIDSTSGTTGEPVVWARSQEELSVTQKLMSFARRAKFGTDDVCLINTFALGPWATGVTLAGAGPQQALTFNPGTTGNFIEATLGYLKKIPEDRTIVLFGYPPNIRKIAEAIQADTVLSGKNLKLQAIVGGEGMSEDLRQDILDKGFSGVFSSYGASDLDINIGNETDTEIAIRKACIQNPALAKELYGGGPPPMIFHYDPLHYYIEANKDGELVFTCCRKERASPRIRYNLHDTGKVMMAKDVVAILKKYGVDITPRVNLPFVFVHGREGAVNFGGAKVQFDHLEAAVRKLDQDKRISINRYALYEGGVKNLEFWIEAATQEAYDELVYNSDHLRGLLVKEISEMNPDFADSLKVSGTPRPELRIFKPSFSPMSMHAKENPQSKLQRVVHSNDRTKEYLKENVEQMTVTRPG